MSDSQKVICHTSGFWKAFKNAAIIFQFIGTYFVFVDRRDTRKFPAPTAVFSIPSLYRRKVTYVADNDVEDIKTTHRNKTKPLQLVYYTVGVINYPVTK